MRKHASGEGSLAKFHPAYLPVQRAAIVALALGLGGLAMNVHAQVMRCTDARTGEVTYTNGRCISGEASAQIQAAQSPEEIAQERASASKARELSQSQMARDEMLRRKREESERKEREAAARAQARSGGSLENSAACQQARARHNAILAEANPDVSTWGERSQAAQAQMEMSCLGATAYQQLQQSRALQPNAINRPWGHGYGYGHARPPVQPLPQQPAKIVNCNVFRCYDNRGGVHPIP